MGRRVNELKMSANEPARPGSRVELIHMDDPYSKLKQGDQGTVDHVDDTGTIHVNWDSGSTLGLIPEVDQFTVLNEEEDKNQYRPFPKGEDRNQAVGDRNAKLYKQAEEEMVHEDAPEDSEGTHNKENANDEPEEEINPYEGKERRFRVSLYCDVHVPMTANLEHDRQMAEQEASEILKKLHHKSVSNSYMGGVAHNPFASVPDPKEFDRL